LSKLLKVEGQLPGSFHILSFGKVKSDHPTNVTILNTMASTHFV